MAAAVTTAIVTGPSTGPPVSSPRTAFVTALTGLTSTNQRSHAGIVSAGTNTLLPNVMGRMTSADNPCTERGWPTTSASAVNTQHSANENAITSASAPTTDSGSVPNRKPR